MVLGGTELFVIACGIVLLFGADRASDLARSAGEKVGTVREQKHEIESDVEEATSIDVENGDRTTTMDTH